MRSKRFPVVIGSLVLLGACIGSCKVNPFLPIFSIIYNGNGNTGGYVPATEEYNAGQDVRLSENDGGLTKTGHIWSGWSDSLDSSLDWGGAFFKMPDHDMVFYAIWVAKQVLILYDSDTTDDTSLIGETSKKVTYGKPYGELPTMTRAGYSFSGWWLERGKKGSKITSESTVSNPESHKLYAGWD